VRVASLGGVAARHDVPHALIHSLLGVTRHAARWVLRAGVLPSSHGGGHRWLLAVFPRLESAAGRKRRGPAKPAHSRSRQGQPHSTPYSENVCKTPRRKIRPPWPLHEAEISCAPAMTINPRCSAGPKSGRAPGVAGAPHDRDQFAVSAWAMGPRRGQWPALTTPAWTCVQPPARARREGPIESGARACRRQECWPAPICAINPFASWICSGIMDLPGETTFLLFWGPDGPMANAPLNGCADRPQHQQSGDPVFYLRSANRLVS
jgi:hypothetical protein